jgi:hypothetical protein
MWVRTIFGIQLSVDMENGISTLVGRLCAKGVRPNSATDDLLAFGFTKAAFDLFSDGRQHLLRR